MRISDIYAIGSSDEIMDFDDYLKDFEEIAQPYCTPDAERMALSVFQEFTADMVCSVYLDSEQTKTCRPYRFTFDIAIADGKPLVSYAGFY